MVLLYRMGLVMGGVLLVGALMGGVLIKRAEVFI